MYRESFEKKPKVNESSKKSEKQSGTVFGWEPLELWPHQAAAIHTVREYIRAFRKENVSYSKAALIQMPTGTGKTGVSAVLSMCFKDLPVVLILTPRIALRKQMIRDIKRKFWEHINIDPKSFKKKVLELLPKNTKKHLESVDDNGAVLVSTPQTLLQLKGRYQGLFEKLKNKILLTIFDEGHYEPAESWGEAVKILKNPTVLLSATPYRNDLRPFPVNPSYIYTYPFIEAVSDRFLRNVEFKILPKKLEINSFASELVNYFKGEFQEIKPLSVTEPRVIVRCESYEEVKEMTLKLQNLGQDAVGIHHCFRKGEYKGCYAHVDDVPNNYKVTYWVHQFKLMEGIDDERFCLLAAYSPPNNDRSIVQQVGRIIRNRHREPGQLGLVFYCKPSGIKAAWERYLKADRDLLKEIKETGTASPKSMVNVDADFPKRLMIDHKPTEYIDSRFRMEFDINAPDAYTHLSLPQCACLYQVKPEEKPLQKWIEEIKLKTMAEWRDHKRAPVSPEKPPNENTRVILYFAYRNSPLLQDDWYFIECLLGATIIHWAEPFLFYYDSGGVVSEVISDLKQTLNPEKLKLLFPNDKSRLVSIGLANTNLGINSLRSRRLQAFSIAETTHGIEDHMYICSSAGGYINSNTKSKEEENHESKEDIRRNVTFRRKRIRETSGKRLTFDEYIEWLNEVSKIVKKKNGGTSLGVFRRFARSCKIPDKPRPIHILLDVFGVEEKFQDVDTKERLRVNDTAATVNNSQGNKTPASTSEYIINGCPYKINVQYNDKTNRYHLEEESGKKNKKQKEEKLNDRFRHIRNEKLGIISYLNRYQAFRIVPEEPGIIYAYGEFYEPLLRVGADYDKNQLELHRLIEGEKRMNNNQSEKGNICRTKGEGWQKGCVFDIIDSAAGTNGTDAFNSLLKDVDTLVCDDMGTEVADFIAARKSNTPDKECVILIHAKAFNEKQIYSASKFAEVCSQAIKNLQYIHRFACGEPPNLNKWTDKWKASPLNYVNSRIRLYQNRKTPNPNPDPKKIWEYIRSIIRNPLSRIEVWIVLGNGISKDELINKFLKEKPPKPEIIQNIYQLESTWSIVSRMGATLRVFTSQ